MKRMRLLAMICLGLFLSQTAPAPVYMKLGDIKGEVTAKDHKEWILLESFSLGDTNTAVGAATGRRTFEPIVFRKRIDKSSPALARAHREGTVYPYIRFDADGKRGTLINAKIVGIQTEQAMESISFNYEKIQWADAPPKRQPNPLAPKPRDKPSTPLP